MKKVLYFALLAAELFIGVLLLSSLWMSTLYIPCVVAAILVVALSAWKIASFVKETDSAAKRKLLRDIAVVMLIPVMVFAATFIIVAVAMIIEFA